MTSYATPSLAYTDLSTYKIETGRFIDQNSAINALEELNRVTGLAGSYEGINEAIQSYQLKSGGFKGEEKVKQALEQFKQGTGINSFYQSTGEFEELFQITTGGFSGEKSVNDALIDLKNNTGISAESAPTGNYKQFYKIISGGFKGEERVKQALQEFKSNTDINAIYELTGDSEKGFQIISGGFKGEEKVKQALEKFMNTTNINATYESIGNSQMAYQIISGGFKGEDKVKQALNDFQKATGFIGTYEPTGKSEKLYQIKTGGILGETKARETVQEFKESTSIAGFYEPIGQKQNLYSITTGGFKGEERVLDVIKQISQDLRVETTYEPIPNSNSFRIIFPKVSRDSLNNVKNYLNSHNWWYSSPKYIGTDYTHYRIKSEIINETKSNLGYQFFENKGWYSEVIPMGQLNSYYIKSELLSRTEIEKGLAFFQSKGWWASSQTTNERLEYYRIKSAPIIYSDVQKGLSFFSNQGWWASSQDANVRIYSYRIVTPSITKSELDNGINFFNKKGWWASSQPTEKIYTYRIISKPITKVDLDIGLQYMAKKGWWATYNTHSKVYSYIIKSDDIFKDDADRGLAFFQEQGWWGTIQSSKMLDKYYQIALNNIAGYDKALSYSDRIKSLLDWNVNIVKTKNGPQLMHTDYGMTLSSMLEKQMAAKPQTDLYRNEPRFVSADFVDMNKQIITGDNVYLRTSPEISNNNIIQQLNTGDKVLVIGKVGNWVEVKVTWQNAKSTDVQHYLDPNNFSMDNKDYAQFLKLSKPANLQVDEVNNKVLSGKGILSGKGQAFIDAANRYNINEVYLISHAILETGHGTSSLATGVEYNGKIVYNVYGYGAYDWCPLSCGAKTAYDNEWFTPEAAIIGGAYYISRDYIYNTSFQQDTLYKIRWNPVVTWHQYASDIGWASKQVNNIYNIYQLIDNYTLYYDVPAYH